MTKPLKQIQKENRKFILEAIHGCSYEEALEKELGVGCKIIFEGAFGIEYTITDTDTFKISRDQIIEIIGKPLTLSRVLLASIKSAKCMDCHEHKNNKYCSSEWHVDIEENLSRIRNFILDNWKNLELETLEEQSEETQRAINGLFND